MHKKLPPFTAFLFALPMIAAAASSPRFQTVGKLQEFLGKIGLYFYQFILIIGVIFIVYAAFKYITAGDDVKQVGEAKSTLLYAVIGLALAVIAGGVPTLISSLLK